MNTTQPGSKGSGWRPENMIVSYRDPLSKAARVAEEVQERGLKVDFYYGGLMGAESRESAVADFRHVIDLCATMQCGHVLMGGLAETRLADGLVVTGGRGNRIEACEVRNTRQIGTCMPSANGSSSGSSLTASPRSPSVPEHDRGFVQLTADSG